VKQTGDVDMRIRIVLLGLATAVALAACASAPAAPPPSPPPSPPREENGGPTRGPGDVGGLGIALPDQYQIVSNVLRTGESYLPAGANALPTGVVLLDRTESARNRALCTGLMGRGTARVLTEDEARRRNPVGDYVVTHWLVRTGVADIGDCSELLAKYDFVRSESVRRIYGLDGRKGPLMLAIDPSGEIVFLDLGGATLAEVTDSADKWMKLALKAPQAGSASPPRPLGLAAGARQVFASIASGFGTFARGGEAQPQIAFNDPRTGMQRQFRIFRAGSITVGATFDF